MTHEPECNNYVNEKSPWPQERGCALCYIARAAYQRGRDDAAKNVEAVAEPFFLTRFNPIDEDAWAVFVNMLTAARGECRHDYIHLKGEKSAKCRKCGVFE